MNEIWFWMARDIARLAWTFAVGAAFALVILLIIAWDKFMSWRRGG